MTAAGSAPAQQPGIGTYNERSLHAAIRQWYLQPGDVAEAGVAGFVADILRDGLIIEIQTRNLGAMKAKLRALLEGYRLRVVYPIAVERWIAHITTDGELVRRRRSPKHGGWFDVFDELVSISPNVCHPGFALEVLLTREEEIRCRDGKGSWRRQGTSILDRRLLEVVDRRLFETPDDLARLLPESLPRQFTCRDIAAAAGVSRKLGQKAAYCLRKMGALTLAPRTGREYVYERAESPDPPTQE